MSATSLTKPEPVVSYVDPHSFETDDTAWAQCNDGLWHRVRIIKKDVKYEAHKPKPTSSSLEPSFNGRHLVAHTQYRARWRPGGGKPEIIGIFAQMKRKLLPDIPETWAWLLEDVGIENVAEDDRVRLHNVTVAPRGWYPGIEKVERRRAPF
ncbi:hypothetical protein PENSPDRAFT_748681 [Peniophora sp. CONT]|nr:hypothetical protein PENSPDRAFT_748681 [Peniophora sp. CONT]